MRTAFFLTTLMSILLLFSGCAITESDIPPAGDICVSSEDAASVPITGAQIFLDNILQGQTTPDTLYNVNIGDHIVKVKKTGYYAEEAAVTVNENEVSDAVLILELADFGQFDFTLDPLNAEIIIDRTLTVFSGTPPYPLEIGPHTVSAFLNGYLTSVPALDSINVIDPDSVVSVTFNLTPGTIGSSIGNAAADFTLDDIFNTSVSLHNYRGYVVLLTFFFLDCAPCMAEFPEINETFIDYLPYGVQVLGLDYMIQDSQADLVTFKNDNGVQFPLLMDYNSVIGYGSYNVIPYPTNIIITPSGEIHTRLGSTTKEQLAGIIDSILGL